jgi:Uma2 family endonuclease
MTSYPPRKRLFSLADYQQMADSGILPERGVELIEGEIIDMSPVGSRHLSCVNTLLELLNEQLGRSVIISVKNPLQLNDYSQPEPDVALLKRVEHRYAHRLPGPADVLLVIEVADTSLAFDSQVKRRLYAMNGISDYWIIDLEARQIAVFRHPEGEDYRSHSVVAGDQAAGIEALPTLALSPTHLFQV